MERAGGKETGCRVRIRNRKHDAGTLDSRWKQNTKAGIKRIGRAQIHILQQALGDD